MNTSQVIELKKMFSAVSDQLRLSSRPSDGESGRGGTWEGSALRPSSAPREMANEVRANEVRARARVTRIRCLSGSR